MRLYDVRTLAILWLPDHKQRCNARSCKLKAGLTSLMDVGIWGQVIRKFLFVANLNLQWLTNNAVRVASKPILKGHPAILPCVAWTHTLQRQRHWSTFCNAKLNQHNHIAVSCGPESAPTAHTAYGLAQWTPSVAAVCVCVSSWTCYKPRFQSQSKHPKL